MMEQHAPKRPELAPPAASTAPEVVTRTLPPDPSLAGLWWMLHIGLGKARVWEWSPVQQAWDTGHSWVDADYAYTVGWRFVVPAVLPEDAA